MYTFSSIVKDTLHAMSVLASQHYNFWFAMMVKTKKISDVDIENINHIRLRKNPREMFVVNVSREGMQYSNIDYGDENPTFIEYTKSPLGVLYVYPSYDYAGDPKKDTPEMALERSIHNYLMKMKVLPGSLSKYFDVYEHIKTIGLNKTSICDGFILKNDILKSVKNIALTSKVILLFFCGHGSADRKFITSNGKPLTQQEIASSLAQVNFNGTVIAVFNCCHSSGVISNDVPSASWTKDLPFKWIHIYTCSGDEVQKPAHATRVMEVMSEVIHNRDPVTKEKVPVSYANLQVKIDEVWEATQDLNQNIHLWRCPPEVTMGNYYIGNFLDDALVE